MSSIPNSAMPRAIESVPAPVARRRGFARISHLAAVPPLIALGASVFALSALRSLAVGLARKVDASPGSASVMPPRDEARGLAI